jgi:guanine deaminase
VALKPAHAVATPASLVSFERGALAVDAKGRVVAAGDATSLKRLFPKAKVVDHGASALLVPGFVDAHVHFPQLDVIGACEGSLLEWLERATFPSEARFGERSFAEREATVFVDALLANGTTTAAVYASPHKESAAALLQEGAARGMRLVVGKASMDSGGPKALLSTVEKDRSDIEELIAAWHGHDDRLAVAVTPRFALSCSAPMLASHGELLAKVPGLYAQTHWAETPAEIAAVAKAWPKARDYLDVYEQAGLLGKRTLLGHGVHPAKAEIERLKATGARVVHCPTSNTFLGSGLAPVQRLAESGVALALATDVGGGTSLSMLRTMSEAWKVAQLRGEPLSPVWLFWLATRGGAEALGLGGRIGSFTSDCDADFLVLDRTRQPLLATPAWERRSPVERLGALMTIGDDRLTRSVYVRGKEIWRAG